MPADGRARRELGAVPGADGDGPRAMHLRVHRAPLELGRLGGSRERAVVAPARRRGELAAVPDVPRAGSVKGPGEFRAGPPGVVQGAEVVKVVGGEPAEEASLDICIEAGLDD